MSRLARCAFAAMVSLRLLTGQEPAPTPAPTPTPPPSNAPVAVAAPAAPANEVRQRAEAMLAAHAERSRGIRTLVADYVQRRTTELSKEPLQSRGEFVFVREPGAVIWRAQSPRVAETRLTATSYEVLRPQKRQLERFRLEGPELAAGLFAVLGGDRQRLLADFDVVDCRDDAAKGRAVVVLTPKVAAVRERLRELVITLAGADRQLLAVAYTDRSGDRVEIELSNLRTNPDPPPASVLALPAGTAVVEHDAAAGKRK